MESFIIIFLKSEVTVIPGMLRKCFGKFYNNTLCNGVTWMFAFLCFLHLFFHSFLDNLLKKMKYQEYKRTRLVSSLWYLGYYGTSFFYSITISWLENFNIFDINDSLFKENPTQDQFLLGFIILSTFYLHSAVWEKLKHNNRTLSLEYLSLFIVTCTFYILRFTEGFFRLTALICSVQVCLEITRCAVTLSKKDTFSSKVFLRGFLFTNILMFTVNYLFIIPYMLSNSLSSQVTLSSLILFFLMILWLTVETSNSVLFKSVHHIFRHTENEKSLDCTQDIVECSLFCPRNDASYVFINLRREIKEREDVMLSKRKPKNKNMVLQTIKCMVALKRKLNAKRSNNQIEAKEMENKEIPRSFSDYFDETAEDENSNKNIEAKTPVE